MTKREAWITYAVVGVIALEVIRHFTWRPKPGETARFNSIGMDPYASVTRRR